MLWFIILVVILIIAAGIFIINKKLTKKSIKPDKDAYGASFGDCSLDLEEMRKKAQEKKSKL